MEENCSVRAPIKFNCWKHHAGFIKKQVSGLHKEGDIIQLKKILLLIGSSQMDLYIGIYSPANISEFIIEELKNKDVLNVSSYNLWLNKNGDNYQMINLPDKSTWTLRPGNEIQRYIHIHPGRYSVHTLRVKATTLKTAICILSWQKIYPGINMEIDLVNKLRNKFAGASPLKSIQINSGLDKLINIFNSL